MGDDDDPWATPAVPAVPANPDRQGEGQSEHQSEHESKHVAVPDVSDGIDPWAVPAASAQSASAQSASSASEQSATVTAPSATGESVTGDASRHNAQGRDYAAQEPHWGASAGEHVQQQENAGTSQLAATDPWQASGEPIPPGPELAIDPAVEPDPWAMSAPEAAPPQPQVAADEDEYSMSDESLGEATAMSMDDIKRLFEVKKVEEFTADDPHNPRNMHQTTKHTEE